MFNQSRQNCFHFFSLFAFRTRLEKQLQKTTPTTVTMETPGDDQSAARIAQLEVKLEEQEERNRTLERKVTANSSQYYNAWVKVDTIN